MGRDADIVVVGAGITGVATARSLAQTGRGVVLIEQFGLGHDRGSSHGASRIFRLSYPDPHHVRLAQGALLCADPGYDKRGALAPAQAFDPISFFAALADFGVSIEVEPLPASADR